MMCLSIVGCRNSPIAMAMDCVVPIVLSFLLQPASIPSPLGKNSCCVRNSRRTQTYVSLARYVFMGMPLLRLYAVKATLQQSRASVLADHPSIILLTLRQVVGK